MKPRRLALAFTSCLLLAAALSGCNRGWDQHGSHTQCNAALNGYPWAPAWTCAGVSVCANEANLSATDFARVQAIGRSLGCEP